MQSDITIKQMDLGERDAVLAFLAKVYDDNPRHSDLKFWNWHFLEPPLSNDDNVPVWLAKSGDRIAGQLAAIPVECIVDGNIERAIWILDMMVDPDFRRMGIAQRLVQAAEQYCPIILGVNTNEQHSPALLQKQGMVIVTKIPRYHQILFPGEALRDVTKLGPFRWLANAVALPLRLRQREDISIQSIPRFGAEFDEFCFRTQGQWPCHIKRSSAFLEWQFSRQPGKSYETIGYFDGDKLLGYAVLFFREVNKYGAIEKAAISDICYDAAHGEQVVDGLISAAISMAIKRRAGGIVTDVLDTLVERALTRHGFWRVKSGLQLMVKSPDRKELMYDAANWFLTRGDSDISIFEHPNITPYM